jgi:hypothetical protein
MPSLTFPTVIPFGRIERACGYDTGNVDATIERAACSRLSPKIPAWDSRGSECSRHANHRFRVVYQRLAVV